MASHRRRGLPRRAKLKGQLKPYSFDGAQRSVVAWLQIRKLVTHPLAFLLEVAVGITRSSINKVWMVPPKANVITLCRAAKDCSGGLGLFAARDICKGERVMVEVPFAAFPYQHSRPFTCAACLKDSRRFSGKDANAVMHDGWERRCQGCGVLRFCSEACEIALSALKPKRWRFRPNRCNNSS